MTGPAGAIEHRSLPLGSLPIPDERVVDVWLIRQDRLPLAGLGALAATSEGADTRQLERVQQRFLLRLLLGAYLDRPGRDVTIDRESAGKPVLVGEDARRLAFSQSHAGAWLAIAVSGGVPVGIDIEPGDRRPRWERLARRYFPAHDADAVCSDPASGGCRRFLDHWTAREALVKAAGRTLAGNVAGIELGADPGDRPAALPSDWPTGAWSLRRLETAPGLVGHVAWAADSAPDLRLRQLAGPG
ncbi:4'-phosphopantetheinyl transferase superfamily protein [Halomonas denitrificans]|nr:4'-phosphopantetheinyl transferase superfamily protein [Halomonas denitrificans]